MGRVSFLLIGFVFLFSACGSGKNSTGVYSGSGGGGGGGKQNEKPLEGKPKNFDGFWQGNAASPSGPLNVQLTISGYPESIIVKYQIKNNSVDIKGIYVGATISSNAILDVDGKQVGRIGQGGFDIKDALGIMSGRSPSNQQFDVTGELQNGGFILNKATLKKVR
jgi:hypothetical protein